MDRLEMLGSGMWRSQLPEAGNFMFTKNGSFNVFIFIQAVSVLFDLVIIGNVIPHSSGMGTWWF